MRMKRRNKPLTARVTRDGVLTIEIGVETLAHAAKYGDFGTDLGGVEVTSPRVLAIDVATALRDELGEDGSTILTQALDRAIGAAIEAGSDGVRLEGE